MSDSGFDMGLGDVAQAGVYAVAHGDLGGLAAAARDAGLKVLRVDLEGCTDKRTLLLRIATHFDTLSRVMYHVGVVGAHDVRSVDLGDTGGTRQDAVGASGVLPPDPPSTVAPVFIAAQAFFKAADPESEARSAEGKWLASEARDAFEDTYQATKARLLHAGAGGHFQVTEVYDWLARLSDLRRAVEQGHKASQRLSAMSDLAPTPTNVTEMPPFRETVPAEPPRRTSDTVVDSVL